MPPETPENAGYMLAAYVVAPVILAGYLASLWRRAMHRGWARETFFCAFVLFPASGSEMESAKSFFVSVKR